MNDKGEVAIGIIFAIAFVASLLAYGTVEMFKNCSMSCKLNLPQYEVIMRASAK